MTGWVVICAELAEHGSLDGFSAWLAGCSVRLSGATLEVTTPDAAYRLAQHTLSKDGRVVSAGTDRYDSDWVRVPFDADRIEVRGTTGSLVLGRSGTRVVS